ncbi:alcohol dehydrogenase [Thalassoglobus neptunius]|uniref:Alcohol dehydrogenase n=1 Tax=Thalassoglobus neptunius TaxID=1938619 RepID=A0A5C5X684_9PLAN|nr:iron-containing alcohol dehydrogenase [Thalassoglobus neptunius]TWT58159.1 alcohol dehydrogenase [Thalassoglobus neptunius]
MDFQLLLPSRVHFGRGARKELGRLTATVGRRVCLVAGARAIQKSAWWDKMLADLKGHDVEVLSQIDIHREPNVQDVDEAVRQITSSKQSPDCVLAIGGGAAIDLAKAVSAMVTNGNGRSVREFLEGVGTGAQLEDAPLPVIAVPTTSGTGTEATKNAVISVADPACKKSLRSEQMVPKQVIVDPELTVSLPQTATATSGMDALTQLIESYTSCRANTFTQSLCLEGLRDGFSSLEIAFHDGQNREARTAMSYAALLSGMALANSGLGMAHGVAAALGAVSGLSHGLACAVMLPVAMKSNREVAASRFAQIGRTVLPEVTGTDDEVTDALIERVDSMLADLSISNRLRDHGVGRDQLAEIAVGSRGNSLSGNPRPIETEELQEILEKCW